MNEKLHNQLIRFYPKIFTSDMYFECGDGWYPIIYRLCDRIQKYINQNHSTRLRELDFLAKVRSARMGDREALITYFSRFSDAETRADYAISRPDPTIPDEVEQVVAHQVKEKWGSLQFYVTGGDRYTDGLICMAEAISMDICETCGNPGSRTVSGQGIATLCDIHCHKRQHVSL